jgi:hypothetical protein
MHTALRAALLTAAIALPLQDAAAQSCAHLALAVHNAGIRARIHTEAADQAVDYADRSGRREAYGDARRAQARMRASQDRLETARAQMAASGCRVVAETSRGRISDRQATSDTASVFVRRSAARTSSDEQAERMVGALLFAGAVAAGIGGASAVRSRRGGQLPSHVPSRGGMTGHRR